MNASAVLIDAFQRIRGLVRSTVRGLDAEVLAWRPDPESNSIVWLVWHLTRVQDDHVAEIAGNEQEWVAGGWAERLGLPATFVDTGYGHSPQEVAMLGAADVGLLLDYHEQVTKHTIACLDGFDDADFDRIIDRSYDPPVTVGVRLVSVISDDLQHVGQAAYVRGLYERQR
jgi:DinB family protein